MDDQFLTLASPGTGYVMERGSKFYGYAIPVASEEEAQLFLAQLKKEHSKARHFCTGLRLFPDATLERFSDDGEPSGSAGRPILGQLIRHNLTNVFMVVVRYFGGTKLGISGLIEAYKNCATLTLFSATTIVRHVYAKVRLKLPYESFPQLINYCKQHEIPVLEESFDSRASILLGFKTSTYLTELLQALREHTSLDFTTIEAYATSLGWEIESEPGAIII